MHLLAQTLLNRLIFNLHGETLKIVVVVNPRVFFLHGDPENPRGLSPG